MITIATHSNNCDDMILIDVESQCRKMEASILLDSGKMDQTWGTLSGGERQRCVIACALLLASTMDTNIKASLAQSDIESPISTRTSYPDAVLLFDEPTAACDLVSTIAVEKAIIESGVASVIITHNERQSLRVAHRRIVLEIN